MRPLERDDIGAAVDEDAVGPLPRDRDGGELEPRLVRFAHEHVAEAHRDAGRRRASLEPVLRRAHEQRPELERERVPPEGKELEQHDARIDIGEAREKPRPPRREIGRRRPLAVRAGDRAGRVVGGHERRELDHLGAPEIEVRSGPSALDEDDGLAGPAERAREPRGPRQVSEPQEVLAVEEDRPRGAHGPSGSLRVTSCRSPSPRRRTR